MRLLEDSIKSHLEMVKSKLKIVVLTAWYIFFVIRKNFAWFECWIQFI